MCFPALRRKVFLCAIWCHSLWLLVSRATQHIMLWCVLLLLCAFWYCIELLLSAIIVQFVMPRARARLDAKWYWPIAPNSTQLTRTHHLSWGYWLENITFIYILDSSLALTSTKFICLHEWNMLIVMAITPSLFYQDPEDVQILWLIFNLRWGKSSKTHPLT